jgi:uncharacterized protein DUF3606
MRLDNYIIDARKPWHFGWWVEQFDVSEEVLLGAIATVGERADAVNAYLDKQERREPARSVTVP